MGHSGVQLCTAEIAAGDTPVGGAGQQVSGVVVEPVEDLGVGVGAVGQCPVASPIGYTQRLSMME